MDFINHCVVRHAPSFGTTGVSEKPAAESLAQTRAFYEEGVRVALEPVWGEHLHLGLFARDDEDLAAAQERAVATMADGLALAPGARVVEVACGLGPAARHLARRYGCGVWATNLAPRQLLQGRERTRASGLADLVRFAAADFHHLPFPDGPFDLWWCQEALLHSPDKPAVLAEAARVLAPGGRIVLSDVTVSRAASDEERTAIYARVRAPVMWDRPDYETALADLGFAVERLEDWSAHVAPSYAAIKAMAETQRPRLPADVPAAAFERALAQFQQWVDFARAGKIGWIYILARRARA